MTGEFLCVFWPSFNPHHPPFTHSSPVQSPSLLVFHPHLPPDTLLTKQCRAKHSNHQCSALTCSFLLIHRSLWMTPVFHHMSLKHGSCLLHHPTDRATNDWARVMDTSAPADPLESSLFIIELLYNRLYVVSFKAVGAKPLLCESKVM